MQRFLIVLGILLLVCGLAWPMLVRLRAGRLPGDFVFRLGGATIYLPLATMLIVSIVLSIAMWLWRR